MLAQKVLVTLPRDLVDEVDRARGDVPRSRVVRRGLELWLSKQERRPESEPDHADLVKVDERGDS